jgi:TolB-like protein/Tfp pilus assembly protein PilF
LLLIATLIAVRAFHFGIARRGHISSIAVMPFANGSGDPNTEYLSDGITDGVIDKLSGLPNMKVISRTSAFRYKKREIEPQKVARELGVEGLVTGTITLRGDDLWVSAELVDAREDRHLWGEQYRRRLADTPSVQQEIATAISENLRLRLTGKQKERLATSLSTNPEAYRLYLKARYHANQTTATGFKKSIDYFQQAIEKDPGFALAYAGLADSYLDRSGGWLYLSPAESSANAKVAAMKALELDPTLAEAHAALAYAMFYDWDWLAAEREFRRAIELNANNAASHERYAEYLVTRGRFDESLAEARQAEELDPVSLETLAEAGTVLLMNRRYDESIAQYQKALDLYPNASVIRALLGYAYALKQAYSQALAECDKIADQDKTATAQNQFVVALLGSVYALSGRRADALKIARELTQLSSQAYISFYGPGTIYAVLGDKDEAFRLLERAYKQKSTELPYLAVDPVLDGIRSDQRYANLLRRMGLPQ